MIAQSVGAVLVATWIHDYAPAIRGLVLASPAFLRLNCMCRWHVLRWRYGIVCVVCFLLILCERTLFDPRSATGASFNNDPLITRAIAVNILLDLYKTSERIIRDAAAITLPTQLLISGDDYVVHRQPQIDFLSEIA